MRRFHTGQRWQEDVVGMRRNLRTGNSCGWKNAVSQETHQRTNVLPHNLQSESGGFERKIYTSMEVTIASTERLQVSDTNGSIQGHRGKTSLSGCGVTDRRTIKGLDHQDLENLHAWHQVSQSEPWLIPSPPSIPVICVPSELKSTFFSRPVFPPSFHCRQSKYPS